MCTAKRMGDKYMTCTAFTCDDLFLSSSPDFYKVAGHTTLL